MFLILSSLWIRRFFADKDYQGAGLRITAPVKRDWLNPDGKTITDIEVRTEGTRR